MVVLEGKVVVWEGKGCFPMVGEKWEEMQAAFLDLLSMSVHCYLRNYCRDQPFSLWFPAKVPEPTMCPKVVLENSGNDSG